MSTFQLVDKLIYEQKGMMLQTGKGQFHSDDDCCLQLHKL